MIRLLLTAAFAALIPLTAWSATIGSQCGSSTDCVYDPTTDTTYFDPTSFHVTSSVATGSDPVLLNNNTTFSVQDINNDTIDQPLTIYFATLVGAAAPVVTSATYTVAINHTTFITTPITGPFPVSVVGTDPGGIVGGPDIYTFVGCVSCDNSVSEVNIQAALVADGLTTPSSIRPALAVYAVTIPQGFIGQDEVNVTGSFADGTIVVPFAENGAGTKKITEFDTSWTNAGITDCSETTSKCGSTPPPPPPPVPEPWSIALLGVGLAGLASAKRLL